MSEKESKKSLREKLTAVRIELNDAEKEKSVFDKEFEKDCREAEQQLKDDQAGSLRMRNQDLKKLNAEKARYLDASRAIRDKDSELAQALYKEQLEVINKEYADAMGVIEGDWHTAQGLARVNFREKADPIEEEHKKDVNKRRAEYGRLVQEVGEEHGKSAEVLIEQINKLQYQVSVLKDDLKNSEKAA